MTVIGQNRKPRYSGGAHKSRPGSESIINSAIVNHVSRQQSNFHYNIEAQGIITTDSTVPFWMRANQFGSIPLSGPSLSLLGGLNKSYDVSKKRLIDYGFSIQGRVNAGDTVQFALIEGYAKARLSIFEFKAGRCKDFTGLVDSTLSSGAFSISGNALGIPKVELSFPDYWTVPLTYKLIAVKGNFAHGWMGKNDVNFTRKPSLTTYFHQKSFYGRFGRPNWRLKLFGGFNHQVFWGSEQEIYGKRWTLSPFDTYVNVILGKTTRLNNVEKSKVGNAMGSIDLGLQYEFRSFRVFAYRQFFYDVGALYYLANVKDGLTGISFTNTKQKTGNLRWNKFLLEHFYSVDQAGYPWSKITPSGDEDYYNNYFYKEGWSYQGLGLGNPLITQKNYARRGQPSDYRDYFINNRVMALNAGIDVSYKKFNFILKATASKNFGTYATSQYGTSLGKKFTRPVGKFKEVNQYSFYFEGRRTLKKGFYLGTTIAYDHGDLLYNSVGFIIKAGRTL